jgi:hypothetical protein
LANSWPRLGLSVLVMLGTNVDMTSRVIYSICM